MKNESIDQALQQLAEALKSENDPTFSDASIAFKDRIAGRGFHWVGKDYTKQLVFSSNPDRIFSTENLDLAKEKTFSIGGVNVLTEKELGTSVTKSNLKELGRLKGLIVDGSVSINQHLYYDAKSERLGLGTDQPNSAFSIFDDGIEIVLGSLEKKAIFGTFAGHDLEIKTDSTTRISVSSSGNITLGNKTQRPSQVAIHGNLAINVEVPDPSVDLHVRGSARINNKLQLSAGGPPKAGSFNVGDIVWNSNPKQKSFVGWICTTAGNPGIWNPFGEIR